MKSRQEDRHSQPWALAGPLAASLLVALSLFLVIRANSDLAAGRFALFMDEGMVFDGVWKILHPASLRDFAFAIVNGGDQRYGRSLWNLTALAAYLPERIWGDTGLIIAERMSQALLLYFAIITLTLTFVRRWPWRLLSLLLLLGVPYADYYFTSPKPEPLELAFLAIFLWLYKRRGFSFGPHWLVLGLAFGTKISALPLVLLFGMASAVQDGKWRGRALRLDEAVDTAAFFFAGLALAVPLLLKPVCFALALIYAGRWLIPRAWTSVKLLILAAASMGAMIAGRRSINLWLDGTFRNTSHGQDEASINAVSWLDYFFHTWLSAPVLLGIAFIGFAGLLVLWCAFRRAREENWRDIEPGFLLAAGGAAMNAAIFVSAHRLWGFYLLPGMVLLLVGLVASMEASFATVPAGSQPDWGQRFVALVSLGLCLVVALFYWLPQNYAALNRVSQRSLDPSYQRDYAAFQAATGFLSTYSDTKGRPVVALWDPLLFLPRDTAQYKLKLFWGPYTQWQSGPEVLVLGKTHTAAAPPVPPDSPVYSAYLAERKGYSDYVIDEGQPCRMTQCYARAARLPDGGEILVRQAGTPPS